MSDDNTRAALDDLISAIYHGPLEEPLWLGFLQRYREAVNADYATLLLRPPREGDQGVVLNARLASDEAYSAYNETFFALDPFVDLPDGKVMTWAEFARERQVDVQQVDPGLRDYTGPIDVQHVLGVDMSQPGLGLKARLRATRGRDSEDFGAGEKALTALLLPHLLQAIRLHARMARIETERAFYESTIDKLQIGTILLDDKAGVLRMNRTAEQLLDEVDSLNIVNGRLQLSASDDNRRLRQLVDEVLAAHNRAEHELIRAFRIDVPLARDADRYSSLGFLLRPLPITAASKHQKNPSLAIFISDPEQRRIAPREILAQLFGLTPSEAALALLLANGLTLDEAATELGVTRNTAKSHLSAVFSKTGVTRQPRLVQLILKSVASIG